MFADDALEDCRSTAYHGVEFWTAGHRVDVDSNKTFEWRMNNAILPLTFTYWDTHEPNNMNSVYEHCIHLLGKRGYVWNDEPCATEGCFVCEIQQ